MQTLIYFRIEDIRKLPSRINHCWSAGLEPLDAGRRLVLDHWLVRGTHGAGSLLEYGQGCLSFTLGAFELCLKTFLGEVEIVLKRLPSPVVQGKLGGPPRV